MEVVRTRTAMLVLVLALANTSVADDNDLPYPPGASQQVHDGRPFDLLMPDEVSQEKTYSLIVTIGGAASDFAHLSSTGYIACAPGRKVDSGHGTWSAGAIKGILELTRHLAKVLPIGKDRIHAVGVGDVQGIFSMMAFGKKSPFVSACFVETAFRGGSVASHLRKRMGVLAFRWDGPHSEGTKRIEERLEGKVRSVELREDNEGLSGEYFAYWIGAMDGRFVPGEDRSFGWEADATSEDAILKAMQGRGAGAFLYFHAAQDVDKKEARALQNVTFFKQDVRRAARRLVAVKLDRHQHADLFARFGSKGTPAVVVLDRDFGVIKVLAGAIKPKALAKALRKAGK